MASYVASHIRSDGSGKIYGGRNPRKSLEKVGDHGGRGDPSKAPPL